LVGVAVNVTLVPAQTVDEGLAEMLTLTGNAGFTVIVTLLDVAGEPVRQGVALDVITHVTTSPFTSDELVYVAELVPTLLPFSFHW